LTALPARKDLFTAMQAGADDFLPRPSDWAEVRVRLLAGKRIIELQEELVAIKDCPRFAAGHDR